MVTDQDKTIATIEQEVLPFVQQADLIAAGIKDDASYTGALEYLQTVEKKRKMVKFALDPFRVATREAYDKVLANIKKWTDPLDACRAKVEPVAFAWHQEQERKRQAEQLRLAAEARRNEEDERLRQAESAAAAGDQATAENLLNEPFVPTTTVLPRSTPKVDGTAVTVRWSAEVTDLRALVKAVYEGKAPLAAIIASQQVLDQLARAQKAELNIPGVKAVQTGGLRIGQGRRVA